MTKTPQQIKNEVEKEEEIIMIIGKKRKGMSCIGFEIAKYIKEVTSND